MKTVQEHIARQMFDEYLNEAYEEVDVCGMKYSTAYVLKNVDETAYRCMFNDWCDYEGIEVE